MSNAFEPLDYAPGDAIRFRKRRWRALAVLLSLAVIAFLGVAGPSAYDKLVIGYRLHQLNTYTAPPDRVVYEEDPAKWPALLAQPNYRNLPAPSPGACPGVLYFIDPLHQLEETTDYRLQLGWTALFAHARRAANGSEHLVVVGIAGNFLRHDPSGASPDNQVRLFLFPYTVIDSTHLKESSADPWIAPQSLAENRTTPLYMRMYAGQIDPNDESHFTIPYQIGDYSDVLDGYLRDDDSVVIHPRNFFHPQNPK